MSIIFDDRIITPLGNAQVAIVNNKLEITNMSNTGFDGIIIENPDKNIDINFDNINLGTDGNIRTTTLAKSGSSIFPYTQSNTFLDSSTGKVNFAYDFNLVANTYKIVGYKNGTQVFGITQPNPTGGGTGGPEVLDPVSVVIAVCAVIGAGLGIWAAIKPSKETTRSITTHPDGGVTISVTIIEDPTPIDIEVDGQTYNVDNWGIEYSNTYPANSNIIIPTIVGTQITCSGVPNLTIESITVS